MQASVSELIEQAVRAGTMLLLAILWMKSGIHAAVGGAAFGAFTGGLIALCFLGIRKNKTTSAIHSGRTSPMRWSVLGPEAFLFMKSSLAIMLMLTRLISPASDLLDALIIPHRLQISGLSQHCKGALSAGHLLGNSLFLMLMPILQAPLDAFLSYIGLESSFIRSLVSILFFTMNMALYILDRFGKK